jgi:hypothetical protein
MPSPYRILTANVPMPGIISIQMSLAFKFRILLGSLLLESYLGEAVSYKLQAT